MARTLFPDRVEVFAYEHPSALDALVRVLKETLEVIQRPDNKDVFDLRAAHLKHETGAVRFVLPYLPDDYEDFLDDSSDTVYDMTQESP